MNKQLIFIVVLGVASATFAWLDLSWAAGASLGFLFGFMYAVHRVYKAATGKSLEGLAEDEVYNRIL